MYVQQTSLALHCSLHPMLPQGGKALFAPVNFGRCNQVDSAVLS